MDFLGFDLDVAIQDVDEKEQDEKRHRGPSAPHCADDDHHQGHANQDDFVADFQEFPSIDEQGDGDEEYVES